jgi:hypothetical protein
MQSGSVLKKLSIAVVCCVTLGLFATPALAGEYGMLKLKVCNCLGTWLNNAEVEASIMRPGEGKIDASTDYTSAQGYVEFEFFDLEDDDEAHVTVTPDGGSPDDSHVYTWSGGLMDGGKWALSEVSDAGCEDSWFNVMENIIRCIVSY